MPEHCDFFVDLAQERNSSRTSLSFKIYKIQEGCVSVLTLTGLLSANPGEIQDR